MIKKVILFLGLVLVVSIIAGYILIKGRVGSDLDNAASGGNAQSIGTINQKTEISKNKTIESDEKKDPIKEQMKTMTLDEKIGQMVIVGVDGYINDENSMNLIKQHYVGGVILFQKNIQNSIQALSLINSLKNSNSINKIPLFLSVDEEGGRVSRMPAEFTKIPTNQRLGQINNSTLSFKIGSGLAEEIKSFGFNMDFAPVLDINSNPKNPVIGDRSFGSNAGVVSKLGVQTMKGIQSQNVIPVVKHFPGHGDTSVDSHVGLPTVNNDLQRLKEFELLPFAEAIRNKADVVMVAHILLPKIDPEFPASFSKTIITGLLRGELGFQGVVVTDDMTMGAISKNYDIGDASVKSINAGSDIILVCHFYDKELAVIQALKKAVEVGVITRERMDESVYRILTLKSKYALTDKTIESIHVKNINSKLNSILAPYVKHYR